LLAGSLWLSMVTGALAFSPQEPFYKVENALQRIQASEYVPLSRASAALEKGNNAQALSDLIATVEQNPVNVLGLFHLGNAYLELAKQCNDSAQQERYIEKAQQAFERVSDLNDDLTLVYFKLGKIALMKNDPVAAKRYYQIGLKSDPHNAALIFNLARVYDQIGDKEEAIRYYQKTLAEDPNFTYAYNNLALIYEDNKDYAGAEKAYKQALKKDSKYNLARLNLGNMYAAMGHYQAAKSTLLDAQAQEPNNEWTYYYLGNMYLRLNQYGPAAEAYSKVVALNPGHVTSYYLMAVALARLNRMDDALQASLHYLQLAPDGDYAKEMKSLILTVKLSHSSGLYFTRQPADGQN
jgi:tetratricopeptide (TPR) repeat protein